MAPGRQYIASAKVYITDLISNGKAARLHLLNDALLTTTTAADTTSNPMGEASSGGGNTTTTTFAAKKPSYASLRRGQEKEEPEEEMNDFYSFIPLEDVESVDEVVEYPTVVELTLTDTRKQVSLRFVSVHKKKVWLTYFLEAIDAFRERNEKKD